MSHPRAAALAAVGAIAVLFGACSTGDAVVEPRRDSVPRAGDRSAANADEQYHLGVVSFAADRIWVGGGVTGQPGSWESFDGMASYFLDGTVAETIPLPSHEDRFWFNLQVAGAEPVAVAALCGTLFRAETPGCASRTPLFLIDPSTGEAVAIEADGEPLAAHFGSFSLLHHRGEETILAVQPNEDTLPGLADLEIHSVRPDGTATMISSVEGGNVGWVCAAPDGAVFSVRPELTEDLRVGRVTIAQLVEGTWTSVADVADLPTDILSGVAACGSDRVVVVVGVGSSIAAASFHRGSGEIVTYDTSGLPSPGLVDALVASGDGAVLSVRAGDGSMSEVLVLGDRREGRPGGSVALENPGASALVIEHPGTGVLLDISGATRAVPGRSDIVFEPVLQEN